MKRVVLAALIVAIMFAVSAPLFAAGQSESESKLAVGIVLPTKDEPRWLQDEARFREALEDAGYSVEILFSQGDPARERSNVEALLSKGIEVLIICPHDGASSSVSSRRSGTFRSQCDFLRQTYHRDRERRLLCHLRQRYSRHELRTVSCRQCNRQRQQSLPLCRSCKQTTMRSSSSKVAWKVLQPKIADGTFVIRNSSEAVALKGKRDLSRSELGKIIGQVSTNWDFNVAKNLAEANLTSAPASAKGVAYIAAPNDGTARAIADVFDFRS